MHTLTHEKTQYTLDRVAEMRFYKTLHILLQKHLGLLPAMLAMETFGRALDLHCGLGFWTRDMAAIYPHWEILGLDADMETIVFAQDLTPSTLRKNIQFLCDDLIELFLRPNCVTIVGKLPLS